MALLRKQADLIERGFYILEEPDAGPKRYLVGPLWDQKLDAQILRPPLNVGVYGRFSSFDLKKTQGFGQPLFFFEESELRNFLVTASHTTELLTMRLRAADKQFYTKIFSNLKTKLNTGELLKAVPYICLEQELEEFISMDAFSFLVLTGLRNKKSGYLFGFFNPLSNRALLGCSPEYIFKTTESGGLITTAVAGTKKASPESKWTEKLKSEQRMVMEGMSKILEDKINWGEIGEFSYGKLSHLKAEGRLSEDAEVEALSLKLHPTPAVGALPYGAAKNLKLGPEPRGYFGGYVESLKHGRPFSLVTIRCFEWRGPKVQVCIGGGILKESLAEAEWAELEEKWSTFKTIWEIGC